MCFLFFLSYLFFNRIRYIFFHVVISGFSCSPVLPVLPILFHIQRSRSFDLVSSAFLLFCWPSYCFVGYTHNQFFYYCLFLEGISVAQVCIVLVCGCVVGGGGLLCCFFHPISMAIIVKKYQMIKWNARHKAYCVLFNLWMFIYGILNSFAYYGYFDALSEEWQRKRLTMRR